MHISETKEKVSNCYYLHIGERTITTPIGYRKKVVLSRNGNTAPWEKVRLLDMGNELLGAKSSRQIWPMRKIRVSVSYHHNLKSWGNDSRKQQPWRASLIAKGEWNREQSKWGTENNVRLPQKNRKHKKNSNMQGLKPSLWKCFTIKQDEHWEERIAVDIKGIQPSQYQKGWR